MFRFAGKTVLAVTFLLTSVYLNADDIPNPGNRRNVSLLGIYYSSSAGKELRGKEKVILDGPRRFAFYVGNEEWNVKWFKVKPGNYSIENNDSTVFENEIINSVQVPPASVVLAPFSVERNASGILVKEINECERQRAGTAFVRYFRSLSWEGRSLQGFGIIKPSLNPEIPVYSLKLASDPEGAQIYIDNTYIGNSPQKISLESGKHRILFRSVGYKDNVYYVRLERNAEITAAMQKSEKTENQSGISEAKETYKTFVVPFYSVNSGGNDLSRLFADTLLLTLEKDARFEAEFVNENMFVNKGSLFVPDYRMLEKEGADLLVGGFFEEKNNSLIIQADMYDVQAETVKAGITWIGEPGLDIFDALDEIAADFTREVDKVLPSAGRTLMEKAETVYSGNTQLENMVLRKWMIDSRWRKHKNIISFITGIGLYNEKYFFESAYTDTVSKFNGPYAPLSISWEKDMGKYFETGINASVYFASQSEYKNTSDFTRSRLGTVYSLSGGPAFVLRGLKLDILFSTGLLVQYSPSFDITWDNGTLHNYTIGPFLSVGIPLKVEVRYYVNKRVDSLPLFVRFGLGFVPVGYRFDLSGGGREGLMGMDLGLYLGMGFRL